MRLLVTRPLPDPVMQAARARFEVTARDSTLPLTRAELRRRREAAAAGRDATIPLVARKGRASYLGERSVGHMDPGATSATYLFDALAAAVGT